MQDLDDEVVYEAVELSKAVFSSDEEVFRESYDGEVEAYMLIQDLRNRIEIATMDSGGMIYPEELESFEGFGVDPEDAVEFFYGVGGDYDLNSDIPEDFQDAGLVEFSDDEVFYGENAFPYLVLLDEAERIVEGPVEEDYVDPVEDSVGDPLEDELVEESNEEKVLEQESIDEDPDEVEEQESDEDKFSRLQGIMKDAVDSDEELVFEESGE